MAIGINNAINLYKTGQLTKVETRLTEANHDPNLPQNVQRESVTRIDSFEPPKAHVDFLGGFDKNYVNEFYSVESATARYAELRDEVKQIYGNDSGLLDYNLTMLDKVFENRMGEIARNATYKLESENNANKIYINLEGKKLIRLDNLSSDELEQVRKMLEDTGFFKNAQAAQKAIDDALGRVTEKKHGRLYELNKISTNENFNANSSTNNIKSLMTQFVSSFMQQIKSGFGYDSAYKSAVDYMNETTKTTSVNSLSFQDFMVFEKHRHQSKVESTDVHAMIAALDSANKAFNNSDEISTELRALLK